MTNMRLAETFKLGHVTLKSGIIFGNGLRSWFNYKHGSFFWCYFSATFGMALEPYFNIFLLVLIHI